MLVLARTQGQSVVIDGKTIVTIERIKGNRVQVSFTAPDDVRIVRKELLDEDHRQQRCDNCGGTYGHCGCDKDHGPDSAR